MRTLNLNAWLVVSVERLGFGQNSEGGKVTTTLGDISDITIGIGDVGVLAMSISLSKVNSEVATLFIHFVTSYVVYMTRINT